MTFRRRHVTIIKCKLSCVGSGKYFRISEAGINKRMGKKKKQEKVFNKTFRWNGVNLSVQSRTLFPYKKHLINKALRLLAVWLCLSFRCLPMTEYLYSSMRR